jgi:hypothetical protein
VSFGLTHLRDNIIYAGERLKLCSSHLLTLRMKFLANKLLAGVFPTFLRPCGIIKNRFSEAL